MSNKPVGMTTNYGTKKLRLEANVKGTGNAWYDPTQVDNIFGFSKFERKIHINL